MRRRVLMVGLEALDLAAFEHLLARGELPNLARFAEEADRAEVRSDGDVLSGSVWATFAAGTGPGHHGVYYAHHWVAEANRYEAAGTSPWHFAPFWSRLAGTGRRGLVLDVPDVPLVQVDGVRGFYGWGALHDIPAMSYPAGFLRDVRRRFGSLALKPDTVEPLDSEGKLALARDSARSIARRARGLRALLADGGWDLCVATFPEPHSAGHYLVEPEPLSDRVTSSEAMAYILRQFDRAWPGIIEAAGPGTDIFLFSPHGMTPAAMTGAFTDRLVEIFLGDEHAHGVQPDALARAARLMPASARRAAWRALPQWIRDRRQTPEPGGARELFGVLHDLHTSVRAGIAGREREGILGRAEGEALLDEFARFLGACTDLKGRPAFSRTWMAARDAAGPRADLLPDLIGVTNPEFGPRGMLRAPSGEMIPALRARVHNGTHTGRGYVLFRAAGGGSLGAAEVDNRQFAATALERLGLPTDGFEEGSFVI